MIIFIGKLMFSIYIDRTILKDEGISKFTVHENSIIWANDCDNPIHYKLIYVQFRLSGIPAEIFHVTSCYYWSKRMQFSCHDQAALTFNHHTVHGAIPFIFIARALTFCAWNKSLSAVYNLPCPPEIYMGHDCNHRKKLRFSEQFSIQL